MINIDEIALKIAKKKSEPKTLFQTAFTQVKTEMKDYGVKLGEKAIISLANTIKQDFEDKGYKVETSLKLGKFRGFLYVTSAIVLLSGKKIDDIKVSQILEYLIKTYSPKYKYKGTEEGVVKFNIR